MKQHLKVNWKYYISPTLLVCLLLAGLWYWRGLTFAQLNPDMQADTVNVWIMTQAEDDGDLISAHYDVSADSPEGLEILETLNALTIHRPPTNLLYQILKPTGSGQAFEAGDYAFVVRVFGTDGSHAALQCNVRSWSSDTRGSSGYLPCSVEGGQETGRTFGRQLWSIAEKLDAIDISE